LYSIHYNQIIGLKRLMRSTKNRLFRRTWVRFLGGTIIG